MTDTLSSTGIALGQAIGGAIDWVSETRTTAKSVDREADPTIESLRRIRNKSRRLAKAASRPPAIGIFGISQAGKSFLVDSLSKGENGRVESMFGNTRLDFMKHVNPPGGGKEATGLVTRFTPSDDQRLVLVDFTPAGYRKMRDYISNAATRFIMPMPD